jgi:hypothetical protein
LSKMYGFVVQFQLALLTLKILIANNRLSESFQPPCERQESAGKINQERTTHIVRIVNAGRSSAFAMAKARGSLALDRLNFFRLEAPHVFHPICATRAVQKASEDYGDRGAALNKLSNAHGVELLLLRVRRSAWYAVLQFVLPVKAGRRRTISIIAFAFIKERS